MVVYPNSGRPTEIRYLAMDFVRVIGKCQESGSDRVVTDLPSVHCSSLDPLSEVWLGVISPTTGDTHTTTIVSLWRGDP